MVKSKINVNIPQRLVDKLRYGSTNNTTEWQFRFRQSGYRILLSLLFYVSSKKCVEKKETILPGIGIYYSFFHLGLGLMSVDPRKNIDDISNFPLDHFRQNAYGFDEISDIPKSEIKHSKVEGFIKTLSQSKIVSEGFYSHFQDVKSFRMEINYRPVYFGYHHIHERIDVSIERSEQYIQEGCLVIKKLSDEFYDVLNKKGLIRHVHDYLPAFIGDGIMESFLENYANDEEESRIIDLLLEYGLTT